MSKRIITLGTWNGNPIEWIVLKEENSNLLLITKTKIGEKRQFSSNNNNKWEQSDIRKFLNDEFFKNAFDNDEQKMVINAYLSSPDGTKDNVFLMDYTEAQELIDSNDEYGQKRECTYDKCCWYRSPNSNNKVKSGYPNICDCNRDPNESFAIRPAIWIRKD